MEIQIITLPENFIHINVFYYNKKNIPVAEETYVPRWYRISDVIKDAKVDNLPSIWVFNGHTLDEDELYTPICDLDNYNDYFTEITTGITLVGIYKYG